MAGNMVRRPEQEITSLRRPMARPVPQRMVASSYTQGIMSAQPLDSPSRTRVAMASSVDPVHSHFALANALVLGSHGVRSTALARPDDRPAPRHFPETYLGTIREAFTRSLAHDREQIVSRVDHVQSHKDLVNSLGEQAVRDTGRINSSNASLITTRNALGTSLARRGAPVARQHLPSTHTQDIAAVVTASRVSQRVPIVIRTDREQSLTNLTTSLENHVASSNATIQRVHETLETRLSRPRTAFRVRPSHSTYLDNIKSVASTPRHREQVLPQSDQVKWQTDLVNSLARQMQSRQARTVQLAANRQPIQRMTSSLATQIQNARADSATRTRTQSVIPRDPTNYFAELSRNVDGQIHRGVADRLGEMLGRASRDPIRSLQSHTTYQKLQVSPSSKDLTAILNDYRSRQRPIRNITVDTQVLSRQQLHHLHLLDHLASNSLVLFRNTRQTVDHLRNTMIPALSARHATLSRQVDSYRSHQNARSRET
ncbi:hypothetical protein IWZ03DRAFT_375831 [Phyllosticta citriasiana]|uniref:Uncharacterized protein n=1 Tax=Phyllosticta citriasiana TaxID=595635 RepID=A0ABR1KLB3_9PEZI